MNNPLFLQNTPVSCLIPQDRPGSGQAVEARFFCIKSKGKREEGSVFGFMEITSYMVGGQRPCRKGISDTTLHQLSFMLCTGDG